MSLHLTKKGFSKTTKQEAKTRKERKNKKATKIEIEKGGWLIKFGSRKRKKRSMEKEQKKQRQKKTERCNMFLTRCCG